MYTDRVEHVVIDVMAMAAYIADVLAGAHRWKAIQSEPGMVSLYDDVAALEDLPYAQPINQPLDPASSSSLVAIPVDPRAQTRVVSQLAFAGAWDARSAVPFDQLEGVKVALVDAMEARGDLRRGRGEFGEDELSLVRSRITWTSREVVSRPVRCAVTLGRRPLMKCTKLDLILRLHKEGWKDAGPKIEPWASGERMLYAPRLRHPLSYFAALIERWRIIAKGVVHIRHSCKDVYYRALLFAPPEKLLPILDRMPPRSPVVPDADFKAILPDGHGEEDPDGDDIDDMDEPPAIEDGPTLHDIAPSLVPSVDMWDRCIVDGGDGTPAAKVYFTGLDDDLVQRGFCPSEATNCCKWQVCRASPDRTHFCSAMYAWFLHGVSRPGMSREEHLGWTPADASVLALAQTVRLLPF
jgi:hypothetical protein